MKIAIINDVHVGQPLERDQKERAASHLAKETLPRLIDHIIAQHNPDVMINLGDLIRRESPDVDPVRYQEAVGYFKQVPCPVIHLVGNHELKNMTLDAIEKVWQQAGFLQKSYGSLEIEGITLVWLGMEFQPEQKIHHRLPESQLGWLQDVLLKTQKPIILLTHCAFDHQDPSGNYFYEGYAMKHTHGFFLENAEQIQTMIAKCPRVEMVVQAHMHYFHSKIIAGVPYMTCPAMGDNICAPNTSGHIPEIYSILTVKDSQLVLKAFSREYCFAGFEWERR